MFNLPLDTTIVLLLVAAITVATVISILAQLRKLEDDKEGGNNR
jgi:hypothetical protein